MRPQDGQSLIDAVGLVGFELLEVLPADQLVDPARIEIDEEADPAAVLGQVLDGQAQPARPRRPQHQPVGAAREGLVGQVVAEDLVVGLEVLDVDAALGHAGRAAGLEDVQGLVRQALGDPAPHRSAAQPLVLEVAEHLQVGVGLDLLTGIEAQFAGEVEPERTSGRRIEVPLHDLAHVVVERSTTVLDPFGQRGTACGGHD